MTDPAAQRSYRGACPGCGAAIEFRSLASTHAVCGYCQSTVVRQADALTRIGKMAEVFDDYSPLQLFAQGQFEGRSFAVVGRLQYQYAQGRWSEWLCALDDGRVASLSEDNGRFVWSEPTSLSHQLPQAADWKLGQGVRGVGEQRYVVTSIEQVSLVAAQGELPKLAPLGTPFAMVELRSSQGQVLSVDYGTERPSLALGRSVDLENLKLTGLREGASPGAAGDRAVAARQLHCPQCASPIDVRLQTTQSLACPACHSLIDVSSGVAGELRHAQQTDPVQPLIALGSLGILQGKRWQVVGFVHRMGHDASDDDETFFWQEYLLFNRQAGFIFLVDADEGWSLVHPVTGSPQVHTGDRVAYDGKMFVLKTAYEAEISYVAGEFYWQVQRGQTTYNQDYAQGAMVLSREQTGGTEVVWSMGHKIDARAVAHAFKLDDQLSDFERGSSWRDVGGWGVNLWIGLFVAFVVVLFMVQSCSNDCDPQYEMCSSSGRGVGGSFGGYSSGGGGHK